MQRTVDEVTKQTSEKFAQNVFSAMTRKDESAMTNRANHNVDAEGAYCEGQVGIIQLVPSMLIQSSTTGSLPTQKNWHRSSAIGANAKHM